MSLSIHLGIELLVSLRDVCRKLVSLVGAPNDVVVLNQVNCVLCLLFTKGARAFSQLKKLNSLYTPLLPNLSSHKPNTSVFLCHLQNASQLRLPWVYETVPKHQRVHYRYAPDS